MAVLVSSSKSIDANTLLPDFSVCTRIGGREIQATARWMTSKILSKAELRVLTYETFNGVEHSYICVAKGKDELLLNELIKGRATGFASLFFLSPEELAKSPRVDNRMRKLAQLFDTRNKKLLFYDAKRISVRLLGSKSCYVDAPWLSERINLLDFMSKAWTVVKNSPYDVNDVYSCAAFKSLAPLLHVRHRFPIDGFTAGQIVNLVSPMPKANNPAVSLAKVIGVPMVRSIKMPLPQFHVVKYTPLDGVAIEHDFVSSTQMCPIDENWLKWLLAFNGNYSQLDKACKASEAGELVPPAAGCQSSGISWDQVPNASYQPRKRTLIQADM